MYDTILRDDLLNLNRGLYSTDDIQYNREQMKKVVFCRTKDKIWLLNCLLIDNVIDSDLYQELLHRTESDYRKANLYLLGLCQI